MYHCQNKPFVIISWEKWNYNMDHIKFFLHFAAVYSTMQIEEKIGSKPIFSEGEASLSQQQLFLTISFVSCGRNQTPYGQLGQNAGRQLSLPYWLSRCSNFISWLLKTVCLSHITLVKQSIRVVKVSYCYIDSDSLCFWINNGGLTRLRAWPLEIKQNRQNCDSSDKVRHTPRSLWVFFLFPHKNTPEIRWRYGKQTEIIWL